MPAIPVPKHPLLLLLLGAVTLSPWGCAPDAAPPTMDRETFIQVYVELRVAALDEAEGVITPEARDRILASHDVTADDLVEFAQVHGDDPEYMLEVWRDIEERLNVEVGADPTSPSS